MTAAAFSSVNRINVQLVVGLCFGVASLVIYLLNTRHGIAIAPDSTRYLRIDVRPYDAPLYPWLLEAIDALGVSILDGAKIIGLALVLANAWLLWSLMIMVTERWSYAAAGTALILFSPQFVGQHASAMSEPLFFFFLLLSLHAFLRFWQSKGRSLLLASSAALGAATLARFTAPPLGAAVAVGLLLDRERPLIERVKNVAVYAGASGAIFFAWVFLSQMFEGRSIGRPLHFYGNMTSTDWLLSLFGLTSFIAPHQIPAEIRVALLGLVVAAAGYLFAVHVRSTVGRARTTAASDMALLVLGLFVVFYFGFLLLSFAIEANQRFDGRYVLPAYVALVAMMTGILARSREVWRPVRWMLGALAFVVLAGHIVRTADATRDAYFNGRGFEGPAWSASPTIAAVRRLPPGAKVYSNAPDVLRFWTDAPALYVPRHANERTGVEDEDNPLEAQLASLRTQLQSGADTYFVFLDRVDWRSYYLTSEDLLVRELRLTLVTQAQDGRIYGAAPDASNSP